jgi:hypothetical protein
MMKKLLIFFILIFLLSQVNATTILVSDFNEGVGAQNSGSINLGQWEKQGANGSAESDTNNSRFLTPGGIRLGSTNNLVAAMDRNGFQYDMNEYKWVRLRFQTDSNNTIDRLEMWFTDTNASTTNRFACFFGNVSFGMNKNIENGFTTFTAPVSDCTAVNTVDLTKVTRIRIRLLSSTSTDANVTFDSLSISNTRPYTGSKVVVASIGGYSSTFTHFFPALDVNGFKGTTFIAPDEIGTSQHLTISQLQSINARSHEVSLTDLNSLNYANLSTSERVSRITNAINALDSNGITRSSKRNFHWPQGKSSYSAINDLNNLIRMGVWDANFGNFLDDDFNSSYSKFGINALFVPRGYGVSNLALRANQCADINLICVFLFGNITDNASADYDYNTNDFNSFIGYLKELDTNGRIDIQPLDSVFKPFPDFNLQVSDLTPRISEDINFYAIINEIDINSMIRSNFGFPDGNVNTTDNNTIFNDKFTDNDYNVDPDWDVQTGLWLNTGGRLTGTSSNAYITNTMNVVMKGWGIHYDINSTTSFANYIYLGTQGTAIDGVTGYPDDFNGYVVKLEPTSVNVQRIQNEVATSTVISASHTFNTGQGYAIDFNRTIDGNITIHVDGVLKGSGTDNTFIFFQGIGLANATAAGTQSYDNFEITNKLRPKFSTLRSFSTLGLNTSCLTVTSNISISSTQCVSLLTTGDVNIQIIDENTLTPISNASVTLNGTSITQNLDGTLVFDMNQLLSTNIIVASSPTKSERTWMFNADINSDKNILLTLLDTTKGSSVEFKIRDINGNVFTDSNVIVNIRKPSSPNIDYNSYSGMTDSEGFITIFLNGNPLDDGDYRFIVNNSTTRLDYNVSTVTVNVPIREDSNGSILLTPFNVSVTGLSGFNRSGLTSSVSFTILANTVSYYNLSVDVNTDFYPRTYGLRTKATENLTIQPYINLVSTSSTIALFFINKNNRTERLPGLFVEVLRNIPGTGTVVIQSATTDATGTFNGSFLNNIRYTIRVTNDFNQICNFNTPDPCLLEFIPTVSSNEIAIDLIEIDLNSAHMTIIYNFIPNNGMLDKNSSGDYNFTFDINAYYLRHLTIAVYSGNSIITRNTFDSGNAILYTSTFLINLPGNLVSDFNGVTIIIIANGIDGNQIITQTYLPQLENAVFSRLLTSLRNLPNIIGYPILVLTSILLTLGVMVLFGFTTGSSGLAILSMWAMLGIFTFVFGWIPALGFYLSIISGIVGFLWTERRG